LGFALQIAHGFFHAKGLVAILIAIALCVLAIASPQLAVELAFRRRTAFWRLYLPISAVYLLLGFTLLHRSHPPIDVVVFENDSVHTLLHGQNPYGINVSHQEINGSSAYYGPGILRNGRVHVGVPYPPLTLVWILPGYVAGDVRYSFLLAVVLTSLLIFYLSPDQIGLTAAMLLLFIPETIFVLTMGWTEPLMLVTLAITVVCARKAPRMLPIALGLFFASKQYSLLAVPLAAFLLPRFSWKRYLSLLIKAGTVAAFVTLPFALWDFHGFWWSLVTFQVAAPFRPDALSVSTLLVRHGWPAIPQWFVVTAVLAAMVFALLRSPHTPSGFTGSLALVSLVFFVLNKQAFCNYYFFSAGSLCLSMASTGRDSAAAIFALARLPANTGHSVPPQAELSPSTMQSGGQE
jgi:hypothetical protein